MELSVLERQQFMLQRLYQQQQNDLQVATTSNNSSITSLNISKPLLQYNSTFANREPNKRKAEFDVEEEEANEQSEITTKIDQETSINTSSKVSEVQKPDYIHVRFRRGQATDSHSLAERARREKISKKMKCLQDLVPGCNNITGKAGMLDEIINYVQSLQKQVEFLSMKLATLNSRLEFNTDNFFSKEIPAYITSLPAAEAQFNATNSTNQSQMLPQKSANSYVPIPDLFFDPSYISQISGWESDWLNLFNIGFH